MDREYREEIYIILDEPNEEKRRKTLEHLLAKFREINGLKWLYRTDEKTGWYYLVLMNMAIDTADHIESLIARATNTALIVRTDSISRLTSVKIPRWYLDPDPDECVFFLEEIEFPYFYKWLEEKNMELLIETTNELYELIRSEEERPNKPTYLDDGLPF